MNRFSEKLAVSQALYALNQGIEIVLLTCTRLEELGFFREDQLRTCQIMAEELRSSANFEVAHEMRGREERDCFRLEHLRREWLLRLRVQGENMPTEKPLKPQKKSDNGQRKKRISQTK